MRRSVRHTYILNSDRVAATKPDEPCQRAQKVELGGVVPPQRRWHHGQQHSTHKSNDLILQGRQMDEVDANVTD